MLGRPRPQSGSIAAAARSTSSSQAMTKRRAHHAILDDEHVAIGDRLHDQPPQARQHEHVLDHDRAGDEIGELQSHDRQDRRQRVGQGAVRQRRGAARQTLGAGVRMKSSFSASSSAERVTRVKIALDEASASGGGNNAFSASQGFDQPESRRREDRQCTGRSARARCRTRNSARRGRIGSPPSPRSPVRPRRSRNRRRRQRTALAMASTATPAPLTVIRFPDQRSIGEP